MKAQFKLICFMLLSCLLTSANAADQNYKIGAVNAVRVLEQSPQAGAARKLIEKEFSSRDADLLAGQKSLKELEDKLIKNVAVMSDSERSNLERKIITKKRDLKRSQDEFREDLNFRRNEELAKIQKQILDAIQKVAIENNYDVVLSEGVIYASKKIDISDLVIKYLKQEI